MFISDQDYAVVIGDAALRTISQVSQDVRRAAELQAIEEIAGYLRPRFDTDAIFAPEGERGERSPLVVMYTCDIALYHMSASLPQKMGTEIRKERYDRAIRWLADVQAGRIMPDLPVAFGDDGSSPSLSVRCGTQSKLRHNW